MVFLIPLDLRYFSRYFLYGDRSAASPPGSLIRELLRLALDRAESCLKCLRVRIFFTHAKRILYIYLLGPSPRSLLLDWRAREDESELLESLGEEVEAVSSLTWNLTFTGDFFKSCMSG